VKPLFRNATLAFVAMAVVPVPFAKARSPYVSVKVSATAVAESPRFVCDTLAFRLEDITPMPVAESLSGTAATSAWSVRDNEAILGRTPTGWVLRKNETVSSCALSMTIGGGEPLVWKLRQSRPGSRTVQLQVEPRRCGDHLDAAQRIKVFAHKSDGEWLLAIGVLPRTTHTSARCIRRPIMLDLVLPEKLGSNKVIDASRPEVALQAATQVR
jgi:hypothetical protein